MTTSKILVFNFLPMDGDFFVFEITGDIWIFAFLVFEITSAMWIFAFLVFEITSDIWIFVFLFFMTAVFTLFVFLGHLFWFIFCFYLFFRTPF